MKIKKKEKNIQVVNVIFQGLSTLFNLISVYQIITIMNSLFQILKEDITNRFIK